MDLKPVIWISSASHLKAFDAVIKATPFQKKFFGFYKIPHNFPSMKQFSTKVPLVYFSKGKLIFKEDALHYNAIK